MKKKSHRIAIAFIFIMLLLVSDIPQVFLLPRASISTLENLVFVFGLARIAAIAFCLLLFFIFRKEFLGDVKQIRNRAAETVKTMQRDVQSVRQGNRLSFKKKILYTLTAIVLFFILLEGSFRVWNMHERPGYWLYRDRLKNEALTSKPWFSKEYLANAFDQDNKWLTPKGKKMILPLDRHNKYSMVTRGVRNTVGWNWTPGDPPPVKVMLLGGSTTYCSEVPDEYTWPSMHQKKIASNEKTRYVRIYNFGVTTVNSAQELERLEFEISEGNIPDVVVFYNGVNDAIQGVFNNKPDGFIYETLRIFEQKTPFWVKGSAFIKATVSLVRKWPPAPKHLKDDQLVEQITRRTADLYEQNMLRAKELCDLYDAACLVFLQPHLYSLGRPMNKYESKIASRDQPGVDVALKQTYPLLKEKIVQLQQKGVIAVDLTNIFDNNQKPIFLDFCHVESDGNQMIADAMFPYLTEQIRHKLPQE